MRAARRCQQPTGLGRVGRGRSLRRAGAVLHEGVELLLVLGLAQTLQEALERLLFVFQAAQRLGLVGVEGAVAGRGIGAGA